MDKLWIVFEGRKPSTAHATEAEARQAAHEALSYSSACHAYSIWTATLDANPDDPGIPIFSTTEGPKETFQGKRKG